MFEYDQNIVDSLLETDDEFKALYRKHHDLKERVRDAEIGVSPVDDLALNAMKKEKLLAKDRMAQLIAEYRKAGGAAAN